MNAFILALLVLALLTSLNYRLHRSILYPPFVFSAMWLLDLAMYKSGLIEIIDLHSNTLAIVLGGIAAFSAGGMLVSSLPKQLYQIHILPRRDSPSAEFWRTAFTWLLVVSLPFFLYRVVHAGAGGTGATILASARSAQLEAAATEGTSWSLLGYIQLFTIYVPMLFAVDRRDARFWVCAGVALIVAILSTGRTDILRLIAGLSSIYLLTSRREDFTSALRLLRIPVALFLVLYVGLIFTNKDTESLGVSGGAGAIAVYLVLSYIVGPLAAFDGVVQSPSEYQGDGSYTFDFFNKTASALHLTAYAPPTAGNGFVFVPFPTNVYSMFKFYFLELGVSGTMVAFAVIGAAHSLIYLKAKSGSRFFIFLYGYMLYSALLSIFADSYYLFGAILRAAIFGTIYILIAQVKVRFPLGFKLLPESSGRRSIRLFGMSGGV